MLNTDGGNRPLKLLLDSFKNNNEEPTVGKLCSSNSQDIWLLERSKYPRELIFPKQGGIQPVRLLLAIMKFFKRGKIEHMFLGTWPCMLLPDISIVWRLGVGCCGSCKGPPIDEVSLKYSRFNFLLFSNSQDGKGSPTNLLWDRSTNTKSCWLWRKFGNPSSGFGVQFEALKTRSWNFGTKGWKLGAAISSLLSHAMNLRLERFINEPNDIGTWK